MIQRKAILYWGVMSIVLFICVACTQPPDLGPTVSLATHKENRVSQAPAGTIAVKLNQTEFDHTLPKLLVTLSNSTAEPIELPTSSQEDCYATTFWFYAKTEMGWLPRSLMPSQNCYIPRLRTGEVIPAGLEKELDLYIILESRGLGSVDPASYMLRIEYLDPAKQEFLLYTDEFQIGPATRIDEFNLTTENMASGTSSFRITNNLSQSLWLAPPCSSAPLRWGWIDEERSLLQRLTEAGSWAPIRAAPNACVRAAEVIEIAPGKTETVDGEEWLRDAGLSLRPGSYRWDLIIYRNWFETSRDVADGYHVFSDVFKYGN